MQWIGTLVHVNALRALYDNFYDEYDNIFVKSITPTHLPPHLECLRHYIYTLHAFYVLIFVETALSGSLKVKVE